MNSTVRYHKYQSMVIWKHHNFFFNDLTLCLQIIQNSICQILTLSELLALPRSNCSDTSWTTWERSVYSASTSAVPVCLTNSTILPSVCISEHTGNSLHGNGFARNIIPLRVIAKSNSFHMRNSELRQRHHCVWEVLILVTKVHDSSSLLSMGIPTALCQEHGKTLTSF